jgi:catechol 2,3-dioxygenase-like lactoylglutathione lyase family enzyme
VIAGVLHFSFTVSDIEESVEWFERVLGLEVVHRQRQDNAYTRLLVGMPDATLEVALLRVPGVPSGPSTHHLELIQYVSPVGAGPRPTPSNDVGASHLALMVTDIHRRYERMCEQGVAFRGPPVEITEGTNKGGFACYFEGPDFLTFELLQPSQERLEELGLLDGDGK